MSQTRSDLSVVAGEALQPYRLIALVAALAVYADKGLRPWGATTAYVRDEEPAYLKNIQFPTETVELQASGAITQYAPVFLDDDGKITATATGTRIGYALQAASAPNDIIEVWPDLQIGGLLYANLAASAEVENLDVETAFDVDYTVPANLLKAGDILRIKAQALVNDNNSTDTLLLKLKLGSTILIATPAVDVADGDVGLLEVDVVIRTDGASGTLVAHGLQALGVPGTVTAKPALKGSTSIDTTAAQAITVTGTWSVAHADNEVQLDVLTVELIRA